MKRTTYIFIGIYLAGIILVISSIITARALATDQPRYHYQRINFEIPQEKKNTEINPSKVVIFSIKKPEMIDSDLFISAQLKISPVKDNNGGRITYPDMEYIHIIQTNDTLNILMDFTENPPESFVERNLVYLENLVFEMESSSLLTMIQSNEDLLVEMDSMNLNSMSFDVQKVITKSSTFSSVELLDKNTEFRAIDSRIDNYSVDLDRVKSSNLENTIVETLRLTGTGKHSEFLGNSKVERIVWQPKNEESKLTIESAKPVEIIFK